MIYAMKYFKSTPEYTKSTQKNNLRTFFSLSIKYSKFALSRDLVFGVLQGTPRVLDYLLLPRFGSQTIVRSLLAPVRLIMLCCLKVYINVFMINFLYFTNSKVKNKQTRHAAMDFYVINVRFESYLNFYVIAFYNIRNSKVNKKVM